MLDWDYEFECPKCHEVYSGEVDNDSGEDIRKVTCDECGAVFTIRAYAEVEINAQTMIITKVD